jgi:hypothetical protein
MVGEMAILGGGSRSATITALRDTELVATVSGEVVAIAIRAQAHVLFKFKLPLETVNLLDNANRGRATAVRSRSLRASHQPVSTRTTDPG